MLYCFRFSSDLSFCALSIMYIHQLSQLYTELWFVHQSSEISYLNHSYQSHSASVLGMQIGVFYILGKRTIFFGACCNTAFSCVILLYNIKISHNFPTFIHPMTIEYPAINHEAIPCHVIMASNGYNMLQCFFNINITVDYISPYQAQVSRIPIIYPIEP